MSKYIIGIDPGLNGAIAVLNDDSREVVDVMKMPGTPRDILDYLRKYENIENVALYMEDVGSGRPSQSLKATVTFAKHCGMLEMAIIASNISFTKVTPAKWMKALSLGNSKNFSTHTAWKNHLKEFAQREFPKTKITLWNADALLIALYGKNKEK